MLQTSMNCFANRRVSFDGLLNGRMQARECNTIYCDLLGVVSINSAMKTASQNPNPESRTNSMDAAELWT